MNVKPVCNGFLFHSSICNNHFVYLLLVHSVSCRDRPPGTFAITDCCFFRVFSSVKSRRLSNFTFSKTSITVYSFHSLVDDNCRTSFCSKKLDNRALFHKVVISRRRHFLTDRDCCTHIATSLIVNGNDVTDLICKVWLDNWFESMHAKCEVSSTVIFKVTRKRPFIICRPRIILEL